MEKILFWDKLKKSKQLIYMWTENHLPEKEIQNGAGWAVGISIVTASTVLGFDVYSGFGIWIDVLGSALLAGLGFFLIQLVIRLLFSLFNRSFARLFSVFVTGMIFFLSMSGLKENLVIWPISLLLLNLMILGGLLTYFLSGRWKLSNVFSKVISTSATLITISLALIFINWLLSPGTEEHLIKFQAHQKSPTVNSPNPTENGNYEVLHLTYGSGTDIRRKDYGEEVDLISKSVNTSSFFYNPNPKLQDFKDWFSNFPDKDFPLENWIESKLRYWYWGFDRTAFPLNAQVWYPQGDGSFPLVMMVHGNHDMVERSELGYAYLGELLASRGYIFVSVDENFLNGYFAGGISGENDARGWLLLKHLELWEDWQDGENNPFVGKVDLNNIALIGHSRGGEAVSVAAAFNKLEKYPDNGNVRLDFQFNIRSVVAIAPVDQQYLPADTPLPLEDINYLVIQGAHDADVSGFSGLRQYQRVSYSDQSKDLFKAAIYIYQANHSQFNSDWGRYDLSPPKAYYLNTQPLLSPEQQRQLTSVYISAFLDTTLKSDKTYLPIFEDYQNAGNWLPSTLYINEFQSSAFIPLANFEEDIDLKTTTAIGGTINAIGLSRWKELELEFRNGKSQDNQVVNLSWLNNAGVYELFLPKDFLQENLFDENSYLVFNLADNRSDQENRLDLSVSIMDNRGFSASLPLSEFSSVLPNFQVQFSKYELWELDKFKNPTEIIMQTYRIPLSEFIKATPDLIINKISKISFVFDQTEKGQIYLDEIGFDK